MTSIDYETTDAQKVAERLASSLAAQYGSVLGSTALIKELGYPSAAAFHQALARGTVPVPIFKIVHRRGSFALSLDVAVWLSRQRAQAVTTE